MNEWAKENPKHKVLIHPLHENLSKEVHFGVRQNKSEKHKPENEKSLIN